MLSNIKSRTLFLSFCLVLLCFSLTQEAISQCTFSNYSLTPSGNICGTTTTITMSGSQSGVTYQLKNTSGNLGSTVAGTGSSISWSNVSLVSGGASYAVEATKSGCSNSTIVATTYITSSSPVTTSDVVITASDAVLYQNDSIVFTVGKASGSGAVFTGYQLFDGSPIGIQSTSNTFVVKSMPAHSYSILISSSCGSAMVSCPTFVEGGIRPADTSSPTALSNQNYIAIWTATAPITDPDLLITRPLSDVKLSVQYFDGLGRPIQTVLKQGSLVTATNTSADLITTTLYDSMGRQNSTLLPYAASDAADGHFRPNAEADQISWYNGSSPISKPGQGVNARTLTVFEPSPLNRVQETFAPGDSWLGSAGEPAEASRHSVKQKYWINTATDAVRVWDVSYVTTPGSGFGTYTLNPLGTYPAGNLYKNLTVDEQNRQVIEFKDKEGHTILKKVQLSATADNGSGSPHAGWLCTYYLYDDFGNLRCVIQPEGVRLLEANAWSFTNTVGQNILKEQCFRYEYDNRNRMIIKQVPGAGPVYMVYDNRDRLVMTQDSLMRVSHKWLTTHYDNLNRADTTWLYSSSTALTSILATAADTSKYPYTAPTASTILTETHYDDYTKLPTGLSSSYLATWNSYFVPASTTSFPYAETPTQNSTITTKGLVTWTRVKVLDSTLTLAAVNIYDDKGRLIQTQSQNITGGVDVTTTQYSWAGWPLVTVQKQEEKKGSTTQTTVVVTKMTYDDLGRVVKTEMKQSNSHVKSGAMPAAYAIVSEVGYDALGQVSEKKIGKRRSTTVVSGENSYTTTPLETQDYDYNIRGWLLGVNRAYVRQNSTTDSLNTATTTGVISGEMFTESSSDLQTVTFPDSHYFGFDLGYDQKQNDRINGIPYDTARYDGNITGMTWKGANDKKIRKYDFGYDKMGRLTSAHFGQFTNSVFSNALVKYDVTGLTYDNNGNILTMNQYGLKPTGSSAIIDQLTYHYKPQSNKLQYVVDAANDQNSTLGDFKYPSVTKTSATVDYTYDGNGNMTSNQNKNISQISYNILNLPSQIWVPGKGTIRYYYDAAGNKLQKRTLDSTVSLITPSVTTYIGGAVYLNDTLQFFGTQEGRIRSNADSTGWLYDYFLKDHLGNTRMMITDDYNVSSPILEAYSYYPFGLQQKGIGLETNESFHNYKNTFQKQELNEDFGIDIYEFKYRMDDPQIGRFWQVDPLADKYVYNSTYAFSENKVTGNVELEGLESVSTNEKVVGGALVGGAAGGILASSLALGGAVAGYGSLSGPGAPAAWLVGGGIIVGGSIGAGVVWIWDRVTANSSDIGQPGPAPNKGQGGGVHGGENHNNALNDRVKELEDMGGATNIRKNQQQVDKDGIKVGRNRPDIQYDKNGVHHNEEYDHKESSSKKHEKTIRKNDPNSKIKTTILKKILHITNK
ncbi:Uncharacterized conserved protein RhaS, contains 28 RHS repeats [Arachidicoccus rhizosphaerae]|uniref:Uncharacterized conserved protein RhaS, contains 28 RHS repeats n=1 Tax=Arachidicoccus rhizosphaerae TaxID=551991 RepID=A0A1H4BXZ8_9BACT|nr:DUF6443 domain-containing protein [Arachidicoccus rhizosphaerae]SEA53051.1 Uncharacterized conserved protein RhaS, contains 28 RHS repeats [Arachidicoccus rhizosphaerae]